VDRTLKINTATERTGYITAAYREWLLL